jgi:hypothetical protein
VSLFEIAEAIARPDHTVTITWSDGVRGEIDFLPIVDRGGWFTSLREGDYFVTTMISLPGGAWPDLAGGNRLLGRFPPAGSVSEWARG